MIRAAPFQDTYISVNGHKIRFLESGKGPPLILIHGLGGSLEWWEFNLDAFSQKYCVIAFDFFGFGLSSKPEVRFSLDFASEFMVSFMDTFQLSKASIIGNSLGGLIALFTALKKPERIDKLVLVDSAGFGSELSVLLRIGSVFPVGELALVLRNHLTVKIFLSRLFHDRRKIPSHMIDCVLRMFSLPRTGKVCLRVLRSGVNLKGLKEDIFLSVIKRASSLPHKTLIVWGADDKVTSVRQAYKGRGLIKNSRLHIFEKCGHLPQVEWSEKFNRLVLGFLES